MKSICIASIAAIGVLVLICPGVSSPAVIDKVVAYIDNEAITLSELEASLEETRRLNPGATRIEVLSTMINRRLLLREAERMRLQPDENASVLEEYIELKVKAFIKITEADILDFYRENKTDFGGAPIEDVRDQIRAYLTEKEANKRLKEHISELKKKAEINILIDPSD